MKASGCIAEDTLRAYQGGTVAAELLDSVAVHVCQCPPCLERLQTLEAADDPLLRALRRQQPVPPGCVDPLVAAAVSRVLSSCALAAGSMLNEYRLLERLGAGGMGTVYRALHVRLDKEVALKVIQPLKGHDPQMRARFQREMKAIGKLRHPHIVLATDAGEAQGVLYLVMELEQGTDLAQHVRRHGTLAIAEACEYARQAALGLQAAHEAGLVHRDVKPSNLLRTAGGQIKLLDLGLARLRNTEPPANLEASEQLSGDTIVLRQLALSDTLGPLGTEDYMAPEQWDDARRVDTRTDLYALGCTLFFLLTGQAPFAGPAYSTRSQKREAHLTLPPPEPRQRRAEIPAKLGVFVRTLLAKNPQDRPASAADVAQALACFTVRPRRRVRVVLATALMVASVTALAKMLTRWPNDPKAESPRSSLGPTTAKALDRAPAPVRPLAIAPMTPDEARDLQNRLASQLQQPVVFANSLDMQFALVPPGEYMDPSYGHERVGQPFYMGVTEVTMGQFRRFVEASGHLTDVERYGPLNNPSNPGGLAWHSPGLLVESDACPVVWVSWNDCLAYCAWLSRADGQTYRLPTITEWIWASRAGYVGREYPGGKERLLETAWFKDNSLFRPHPVGQLRPNAWGLYDSLGNVSEWTWDRLGPDRIDRDEVPVRPPSAGAVIGNGFRSSSGGWRINGNNTAPTHAHSQLGFRVLCELRHPKDAR